MKSVIFKTEVAVANVSEAVEADTISKHGCSSTTSHKSWKKIFSFPLFVVLIAVFIFGSCDKDNKNDVNPADMIGTWVGTLSGISVTVDVLDYEDWELTTSPSVFSDYGTYTMKGKTATLYSEKYEEQVGRAEIINSNSIKIILNQNSIAPGTHTLTRKK